MKRLVLGAIAAGALLLGGCGGGHSFTSAPAAQAPQQTNSGNFIPVTFSVVIPSSVPAAAGRNLQYVSSLVSSITVSVSPGGSVSQACHGGTCSVTVQALPGSDTFTASLFDRSGALISQGVTTAQIQRGVANNVSVTFNPVVAALQVTLNGGNFFKVTPGTPATIAVGVQALDADGNQIVGPGNFINASGTPVTVTFSSSDTGGSATMLSSGIIKGPNDPPLTLTYSGASATYTQVYAKASVALATMGTSTRSAAYQAMAAQRRRHARGAAARRSTQSCCGPSIPGSITPGTLTIAAFTSQAAANINDGMVIGPDGNFWASGGSRVVQIVPNGSATAFNTAATGDPIIVGPDKNLWMGEENGNIVRVTTLGVVTETTTSGGPTGSEANGSDGNVWFTEDCSSKIGKVTTAATPVLTEYPSGASAPTEITAGPDGKLWYADGCGTGVYTITTSGVRGFVNTGFASQGIAVGPDGNMWVTGVTCCPTGAISRISPTTGAITNFAPSHPLFDPTIIAAGPDGNLWFGEAFPFGIGRITPSGTITEWPVGFQQFVDGIAFANGKVWFSSGGSAIGFVDPANPSQGVVTLQQNVSSVAFPDCISAEYGVPHMLGGTDGKLWALDPQEGLLIHQSF